MREKKRVGPKRQPTRMGLRGERERAAKEGEKGKLPLGGRRRRSGTGRGPREDRKAGRGESAELGTPAGTGRGGGGGAERPRPSPGKRRDSRRAGPEKAARGPAGCGGRDAVPWPLSLTSGHLPPRSWGTRVIRRRQFRAFLPNLGSRLTRIQTRQEGGPRLRSCTEPAHSRLRPVPLLMLLPPQ
uniref:collagen alpha-1(VI) chain-like n=1 Tax=Callithrix jacchus TaxID=9483 RepID=UPI0023DD1B3C|nr:collagen alpha-1(VI) chain-like [Callithrix jacchus]